MKRQSWKKLGIWTIVLVTLASTLSLSVGMRQVMAVSVSEAVAQMKEAAQVQLVANVFSKCVQGRIDQKYITTKSTGEGYTYEISYPGTTDPFIELSKHIPTGAWLEMQVQGKVNNGTIYCSDDKSNIVNAFANAMGIDKNTIFCDGNNPGILKLQNQDKDGVWKDVKGECAAGLGNSDLRFVFNDDGALDYVKKLYDNRLKNNPYKVAWGDRGTFTDSLVNYYLYLSDFETACGTSRYTGPANLMNETKVFSALKMPNVVTGELEDVYFLKSGATKTSWGSNWINDDGPHTCEAVIARMNELSGSVQTALNAVVKDNKKAAKDKCNGIYTTVRRKLKTEMDDLPDEEEDAKKAIQERIDLLTTLYQNGIASGGYDSNGQNNDRLWKEVDGSIVCRLNADNPHELDGDNTPLYSVTDDTNGVDSGLNPVTDTGQQEQSSPCSKAAGGLSWIICTVIQGVGVATNGMYDYIEQGFLQTKVDYMTDTSGTHNAWETFRNFANIFFAIVLLVIILSQITGFGVNNYGIKKILPSLILVAVLVNVSFFLCQVAVDLSNIVGYGINDTFAGLSVDGVPKGYGNGGIGDIVGDGTSSESGILGTLLNVGGTGATILGAVALVTTFPTWIWGFLLVLLSAAISIIFFFILLGVRQAGIIILVALAPVAIICYALPNTKSIFNRWWKMFVGLLLVYPICGALMGGGQFASRLLLANIASDENGTFFYVLVAMLVQVVPFFFIPSIVKSSFAAMGNLGMKLSNFGRGLSRGATGAIRKSEGFKSAQARGRARTASWAYGRNQLREKLRTKGGRLGKAASYIPGMGGISAAYRNSNWIGSGMARDAYNRRQAGQIGLIAAQQAANRRAQMTAENGLAKAEENENNALREDYARSYARDLSFVNDPKEQEKELERALNAVEQNPSDQVSMAQLRGLHDFLGKSDDGQKILQRVYNSRMKNAQDTTGEVSSGMQAAAANLANDHTELKGVNRGFYKMLTDMASSDSKAVFKHGKFENKSYVDASGKTVSEVGNDHYDSMGAMKYDPRSIANAGEGALQRLASGVGAMTPEDAAAVYRSATEAITNDNIEVKPENEKYLNDIRRAAYAAMQADFTTKNAANYFDDKGRAYEYDSGSGEYVRHDDSGDKRFSLVGGDMVNVSSGKVIKSKRLMGAAKKFKNDYGNYQDLHAGIKISH